MTKRKRMTKVEKAFIQGYACAAGVVAWSEGLACEGQAVLSEGGFNKQDLIDAEVDEGDMRRIFPEDFS